MTDARDHVLVVDRDREFVATVRSVTGSMRLDADVYGEAEPAMESFERLSDDERSRYALAAVEVGLPRINGVQLAWRLRQLAPPLVIAAVADDLGVWEPDEIRECGINRVWIKPVPSEDLRTWLVKLTGNGDRAAASEGEIYYRVVTEELAIEKGLPYARVLDADRVVVFENEALRTEFGSRRGRNHACFGLFGGQEYCERCIVLEALTLGKERTKRTVRPSGGVYRMTAVPTELANGRPGVVELFGPET